MGEDSMYCVCSVEKLQKELEERNDDYHRLMEFIKAEAHAGRFTGNLLRWMKETVESKISGKTERERKA